MSNETLEASELVRALFDVAPVGGFLRKTTTEEWEAV